MILLIIWWTFKCRKYGTFNIIIYWCHAKRKKNTQVDKSFSKLNCIFPFCRNSAPFPSSFFTVLVTSVVTWSTAPSHYSPASWPGSPVHSASCRFWETSHTRDKYETVLHMWSTEIRYKWEAQKKNGKSACLVSSKHVFFPHRREVQQWLNNSTTEASSAFTQQMEPVSHDAGLAVQTSHITGSVPIPSLGFAASLQSSWSRMRHRQQCSLQHSHTHIPVGLLGGGAFMCVHGVVTSGAQKTAFASPTSTTFFWHLFIEIMLSKRQKKELLFNDEWKWSFFWPTESQMVENLPTSQSLILIASFLLPAG